MKSRLGFNYYFSVVINVVTLLLVAGFMVTLMGLDFKRMRGLTASDFSIFVNDFKTAKPYFVSFCPAFTTFLVVGFFFMRLAAIKVFDDIGVHGSKNDKYQLDAEDKDEVSSDFQVLKIVHIVGAIIALGFLIACLVLLSIDAQSCNDVNGGSNSLCSDKRYCCAMDVITPPGITDRCPYVTSCNLSPPVSTGNLDWDPFFTGTFAINLILIILMIGHLIIAFFVKFGEVSKKDVLNDDEVALTERKINYQNNQNNDLYKVIQ